MSHESAQSRRLPLLAIIRDAFALPWKHRVELFRAAGLPLLALIGITLLAELPLWGYGWASQVPLYVFQSVGLSWLAITLHRLVLLDEASANRHFERSNLKRIALYALALVGILILFTALMLVLLNVTALASGLSYVKAGEPRKDHWWLGLQWFASLMSGLFVSRFAMLLPAVALDQAVNLKAAWRMSRGNGLRLAVVFMILPWVISYLSWMLYREGASAIEFALLTVLSSLLAIVEIVALSLSYGAFTAPEPLPTDPPG